MRILSALVVVATVALGVTGCASGNSVASCGTPATPGANTSQVKVSGTFGAKPTVDFAKGLTSTDVQAVAVIPGNGPKVADGQSVAIDAQLYNGQTGALIQSTTYDGKTLATIPVSIAGLGGLAKALTCQNVGSRVVAVIGNDQTLNTSIGLAKTDTVVAVVDIVRANLAKANGAVQKVPDGLPQIVSDANGVPGITVPSAAAPTQFTLAVLKKGEGPVVAANATATVHYVGVTWSKTPFSLGSSWKNGVPVEFSATSSIPGFWKAIQGQTVGSQVLAIVPPNLAYGDKANGQLPANSTLIFVIDILGTNT